MTEAAALLVAAGGGVLLGALYFGGLWLTIRHGLASGAPGFWFLGSVMVRTGLVLGGFWVISGGDWRRLVASLVGFIGVRLAMIPRGSAWRAQ